LFYLFALRKPIRASKGFLAKLRALPAAVALAVPVLCGRVGEAEPRREGVWQDERP